MKHTDEQTQILTFVPDKIRASQSILIEARAGSGKTFILTELAPLLPGGGQCLAFNRAIADELRGKLPPSCPAATFHSLGFSLLRERTRTKSDPRKLYALAKKQKIGLVKPYQELVSAMKINGLGLNGLPPISPENLKDLIDLRGIEVPPEGIDLFIKGAIKLFKASLKQIDIIDFDDMLYLPLYLSDKYKWKFDQYPFLLIDEAQDVSPLRLEMIKRLTGTVIAVGDPYQSIYGFAGAISGALQSIEEHYQTDTFNLSCSFRCPTAITEAASLLIAPANIKSLPDAPRGAIIVEQWDRSWYPTSASQVVLCRMNQPLFVMALRMLRQGQPVNFNSDFPRQLIAFMKRFKAKTNLELKTRLTAWFEEQAERYASGTIRKGAMLLAQEKHDTLMYITTQCEDPATVQLTLETLLTPKPGHPTLSTIHKSKGLEWPRVYLLRPDLIPAPFAESPEELEQENNLHYVAVTRSGDTFTYLEK